MMGLLVLMFSSLVSAEERRVIVIERENIPHSAGKYAEPGHKTVPAAGKNRSNEAVTKHDLVPEIVEVIRLGKMQALRELLLKASPGEKAEALRWALLANNTAMLDLVLKSGVGEISPNKFDSLLYLAIKSDNADNVRKLIGGNLITDAQWQQRNAALGFAKRIGNKEIISILENSGANKRKAIVGP